MENKPKITGKIKYRTNIFKECEKCEKFNKCNILERLSCGYTLYRFSFDNGVAVINTEIDLNKYPSKHENGMEDKLYNIFVFDDEILYQDIIKYLNDENSNYLIRGFLNKEDIYDHRKVKTKVYKNK